MPLFRNIVRMEERGDVDADLGTIDAGGSCCKKPSEDTEPAGGESNEGTIFDGCNHESEAGIWSACGPMGLHRTHWYCPPLEGKADANSARPAVIMEQAIVAATRQYITPGPPPANKGVMKTAEYPIHEFVILKAKERRETVENCRGSSPTCPCARSCNSSSDR